MHPRSLQGRASWTWTARNGFCPLTRCAVCSGWVAEPATDGILIHAGGFSHFAATCTIEDTRHVLIHIRDGKKGKNKEAKKKNEEMVQPIDEQIDEQM